MIMKEAGRRTNLLNGYALFHGIQYFLRSAFRADPYGFASTTCKGLNGIFFQQQIGTRLNFVSKGQSLFLYDPAELVHPSGF